jgi:N-acetylmuramoyl-L-alanine amidase
VFLDPAHGGTDSGAHLSDKLEEKDVTLAFEQKLRSLLAAKGLTVVSARDNDTLMTSDQRAEIANHGHPIACILIHATSSGSGTYLATSSLPSDPEPRAILPWDTAQATYISQSLGLLEGLTSALATATLKPVTLQSSVPPIDSLTCPAVLIEFAPRSGTPVNDEGYQQKLAEAITGALVTWKTTFDPPKPVDPSVYPLAPKAAPRPKTKMPVAPPAPPTPPGAPLRSVPSITRGGPK